MLDVATRDDLALLMSQFYVVMLKDEELAPIFTDVARIHLETHLPVLVDFWEGILFSTGNYAGNPMAIHIALHRQYPLTKRHFELWLGYFTTTVDAYFKGEKADMMKIRALSIATVMQIKLMQSA
jgi:hemoglobin